MGVALGLRIALRVALLGEEVELDRRSDDVLFLRNRLRLLAGCSGEVVDKPKLASLPLRSMAGAAVTSVVCVNGAGTAGAPGVEPGSVDTAVAALPCLASDNDACMPG